MKLLISGILPFDSGKTTFSLSIIREMKNNGISFFPLKPVAGHNAWYSFSTLARSYEIGALAGNDALKYYDEVKKDIRKINPFAALLSPIDIESASSITYYQQIMERGYPVLVRISCGNEIYFGSDLHRIPKSLRETLSKLFAVFKPKIVTTNELAEVINNSPSLVEECVKNVMEENDNVIVESYNDAIAPTLASTFVDLMFLITPGKALLIKGDELRKVLSVISLPPWITRSSSIMEYIKIEKSYDLDILTSKNDKIIEYLLSQDL
ncbi:MULTISPECIES: ATPase [Acidianus]|uniref:ATPase n=1 Tax=Candidatus Acidianus copahuensis TaxID=1160895 RepID=A0A031LMQ4_9CREN|nr:MULTISPECIES: ATPase [Acidianus]EZQ04700.1 ATPase [Candidatus Acidianus copahuensis]NON61896.1 ATPase [Acidianus sp. RZ1]